MLLAMCLYIFKRVEIAEKMFARKIILLCLKLLSQDLIVTCARHKRITNIRFPPGLPETWRNNRV